MRTIGELEKKEEGMRAVTLRITFNLTLTLTNPNPDFEIYPNSGSSFGIDVGSLFPMSPLPLGATISGKDILATVQRNGGIIVNVRPI